MVKILASSPLGSRKHVMLVAVAGEVLILGTTATDLVPLGKVTDPEQLKLLLADPASASLSAVHAPAISIIGRRPKCVLLASCRCEHGPGQLSYSIRLSGVCFVLIVLEGLCMASSV